MRKAARIPIILYKLGLVWYTNPDWRFGQLLWNIKYLTQDYHGPMRDPHSIEDDKLEALLDAAIRAHRGSGGTARPESQG